MAHGDGGCDFVEADSAEAAHGASEIRVDRVFADADRFKIWAPVYEATVETPIFDMTLTTPLAARLDIPANGCYGVFVTEPVHVCGDEIFDAFERKVRIDCSSPIADQERHVMNFAGVTRFDDEANRCVASFEQDGGEPLRSPTVTESERRFRRYFDQREQ